MLAVESLDVFHGDAQALEGVSLAVDEGTIVAIVGANGAGKTSLIRTIAGMHRPSRGRVVFRGTDISGWPSHRVCDRGIGQVAEGRQVFPSLTVAENLDTGAMVPRAGRTGESS
jgi:branched-chain amino acid transport system ATP-binding protein